MLCLQKGKGPIQQSGKGRRQWNKKEGEGTSNEEKKGKYPNCQHYNKTNHLQIDCWFKNFECRSYKQKGHIQRACKNKQECQQTQVVDEQEEELFVASCFTENFSNEAWLFDSDCIHHMTNDESLFKKIDKSYTSKVKIGNGVFIEVKGKGNVAKLLLMCY